jgi:predicted Fe-Mo cluster-binding NifX family protein
MKIAFTYQNKREITGHAGKTSRFLIYQVNDNVVINTEVIDLPKDDILHNRFHNSDNPYAPHPIFNVDVLITAGAGQGFIQRLASQNVQVLITTEQSPEVALKLFLSNSLPLAAPGHHAHH